MATDEQRALIAAQELARLNNGVNNSNSCYNASIVASETARGMTTMTAQLTNLQTIITESKVPVFSSTGSPIFTYITTFPTTYGNVLSTSTDSSEVLDSREFGLMYIKDNGTTLNMSANDTNNPVVYFATGLVNGFTFLAGNAGASFTAVAEGSSGQIIITSATHGFIAGQIVYIYGATYAAYRGWKVINSVTTNTFNVVATWSGDDTGTVIAPSALKANTTGIYKVEYCISGSATSGDVPKFIIYKNITADNTTSSQIMLVTTNFNVGSQGIISLTAGDYISLACQTNDITHRIIPIDASVEITKIK